MTKGAYFLNRPVYSLQTMLRQIAAVDSQILPNIPNGTYTESTAAAVRSFQRAYDLPVNGTVDQKAWEQIVDAHNNALSILFPPQNPLLRFPVLPIKPGESNEHLRLAQAMLITLSDHFSELQPPSVTGILDAPTERGLRWIQAASDLPINGALDILTWNHLTYVYHLMIGDGGNQSDFG